MSQDVSWGILLPIEVRGHGATEVTDGYLNGHADATLVASAQIDCKPGDIAARRAIHSYGCQEETSIFDTSVV